MRQCRPMSNDSPDSALPGPTVIEAPFLPEGALGIDAGLTLTKVAFAGPDGVGLTAFEASSAAASEVWFTAATGGAVGCTGAKAVAGQAPISEIDAAARGVRALLDVSGHGPGDDFVLALLGTGTAFAAVRGDRVTHLGGTALGGGSFAGLARRIDASMSYHEVLASARRGDRRKVDVMVADAYPDGIGRIGADLTAAHLAKGRGSIDDFLAGLLNLHGESIGQIAAGRALSAGLRRIVLAGGFAHDNDALTSSIAAMAALFGMRVDVAPHAGYAGAIGAGLIAVDRAAAQEAQA